MVPSPPLLLWDFVERDNLLIPFEASRDEQVLSAWRSAGITSTVKASKSSGSSRKHLTAWLRGLASRTSLATVPWVAPSSWLAWLPTCPKASSAEAPGLP
jgi:hypothetical protein